MKRTCLALSVLLLAACDTGSMPYMGIAPQRITVGEMVYDVRVRGLMAEALRQNMMWRPNMNQVAETAAVAMQRASGCEVIQMRGDPSMVEGRLKCGNETAPKFPKKRVTKVVLCSFERATVKDPEDIEDYQAFCV